ncbi:hypothetical protein OS493_030940 [Desmophyllum pertusum]|uniref:RGS domain-containing protein n=1 Tax=Desmophyllum pertusum TaxID=174260 RepID=A0A9X0D326_9CNID|nr:hypothetical protein OS493_030940 [Desmophyllum pertusum]
MSKAVLALLFAVFALTTGLPVRNRFYEDVDDYRREFIPKDEAADFDESVYDEYLRRRQPIDLNEALLEDSPTVVKKRVYNGGLHGDEHEEEETRAEEYLARDYQPEEDEREFDEAYNDYWRDEQNDAPIQNDPAEVYSDEGDEYAPEKYSKADEPESTPRTTSRGCMTRKRR